MPPAEKRHCTCIFLKTVESCFVYTTQISRVLSFFWVSRQIFQAVTPPFL